jgi:formamidopyrimidine-DNA glycosylase
MPELPEVETIRRRLAELVVGKTISQVEVLRSRSFQGESAKLIGQKIVAVNRRAKILQLKLANDLTILVHLKMTGQLILVQADGNRVGGGHPTADWTQTLPSSHTRVLITFEDGDKLFFNDQRVFGWLKIADGPEVVRELAKYGPDINDPRLTVTEFGQKLAKTRMPIKLALLNSALVAGLGNIYVCDALNLAEISPIRPANSLSQSEIKRLFKAAQHVIERGIALNGTTFDGKYVDVSGFAGHYQDEAMVYDRENQTCKNCGSLIQKIRLGGRGTYFCAVCQI